ncbi:MAG: hypothetical protein ACFFEV_04580, partial [Candidatus Thorarchaeota archaeon]
RRVIKVEFDVRNRGDPLNPVNDDNDDEMVEKAKQLLLLTDLIDKYPKVVARRVSGLVYLIIAGGISFATLIYMSLQNILGPIDPVLVNLFFVGISLFFSWLVAFRLVLPLTQSYPEDPKPKEGEKAPFVVWGILAIAIVIVAMVTFSTSNGLLFIPLLQLIMGTGFLSNYVLGKKSIEVDIFTREHLYFAFTIFLSLVPMFLFLDLAYVILIVVDMGGIYGIGIYMLITAERLLLESKRQG